jgi:hypothetical protein
MAGAKMSAGQLVIFILAAALHLVAGYFYLASGLVAPLWGVALLMLIWLALAVWGYRNRHRPLVLLVPVVAAVAWFVILTAGETLFGWTP